MSKLFIALIIAAIIAMVGFVINGKTIGTTKRISEESKKCKLQTDPL